MLKRISLIAGSIAPGCIVTIAPVVTSLYVANKEVQRRDRDEIREFAQKAVMRAELVTYRSISTTSAPAIQVSPGCKASRSMC